MLRKSVLSIMPLILFFIDFALADSVDTIWVRRCKYGGGYQGQAVTVDRSGNAYVVAGPYEYLTIKYRLNGDTAWTRHYDRSANKDNPEAVIVDGSGSVYVSGKVFWGADIDFNYYTIKYDSLGQMLWAAEDSGSSNGNPRITPLGFVSDVSGNVYLGGFRSQGPSFSEFLTIKRRLDSDTAWVRTYNSLIDTTDQAQAIAVDDSGNVYVTGVIGGDGAVSYNFDYCTIKYRSNGDTAWVRQYNGPKDSIDDPCGIAVDGSGNVYVTGRSMSDLGGGFDYCTIKYRFNGDTAWVRRYSGIPGWSADEPCGLVVDQFGNVTVTGYSNLGSGYDYCTVSYDSTGNQKWVARYRGPIGGWNFPHALAVDKAGNVYVTGQSDMGGLTMASCTIKYDTSGAERWIARYDSSRAYAVALDTFSTPHVYVTGICNRGNNSDSCLTIKYVQFPSGVEMQEKYQGFDEQGLKLTVFNPARSELVASYFLPRKSEVSLTLYNVLGQRVTDLVHGFQNAGKHTVKQRIEFPSGVYFLRLVNPDQEGVDKVIVVR